MKIYKKFVIMLSVSLAVFSGIVLTTEAFYTQPEVISQPQSSITTPKSNYIVKEYQGKIAVFSSESDTPLHILPNPYVRDLPEYDRKLLEKGIEVNNNADLLKLLEDYDG